MPLLALLPLLLFALLLLSLLLWPLALWQRYRSGRARRRAVAWVVSLNAWSLLVSAGVFLAGAWLAGWWIEGALRFATIGVLVGVLAGQLGLWLTRFEPTAQGLYYTPNRWLVLALTCLVLARVAWGLYRFEQAWVAHAQVQWLAQQGGVFALGGLLLGHYLAYAWGLRRRVRGAVARGV